MKTTKKEINLFPPENRFFPPRLEPLSLDTSLQLVAPRTLEVARDRLAVGDSADRQGVGPTL